MAIQVKELFKKWHKDYSNYKIEGDEITREDIDFIRQLCKISKERRGK